jgi:hypothetical protein
MGDASGEEVSFLLAVFTVRLLRSRETGSGTTDDTFPGGDPQSALKSPGTDGGVHAGSDVCVSLTSYVRPPKVTRSPDE